VGQSEIEIAGLADITLVVLVPESGDEIQTMKAGLMEIADIFVVNKSDRPGADAFVRNLRQMLAPAFQQEKEIPIVQTVAADKIGIDVLYQSILSIEKKSDNSRKYWLLAQRAYHLIQQKRMKDVDMEQIKSTIKNADGKINLYQLVKPF
jgi:LAO/AO transport system kinase